MPQTLSGDQLSVVIDENGAEIRSVKALNGFEFMWQANPDIWGRTAPILFPIVGKLFNDRLMVNKQSYALSQHGFARDRKFDLVSQSPDSLHFALQHNNQSLNFYPYPFLLEIIYTLYGNTLLTEWRVSNTGNEHMYFSIGGHPGFSLKGKGLPEYLIRFEGEHEIKKHLLESGLLNNSFQTLPLHNGCLHLHDHTFDEDAIVLKQPRSSIISLEHLHSSHQVEMHMKGFPYFGIWSKKGCSQFVCLEPWYGIADAQNGHADISVKEGICSLLPGEQFSCSHKLKFTA